jgi:hypothetical protein
MYACRRNGAEPATGVEFVWPREGERLGLLSHLYCTAELLSRPVMVPVAGKLGWCWGTWKLLKHEALPTSPRRNHKRQEHLALLAACSPSFRNEQTVRLSYYRRDRPSTMKQLLAILSMVLMTGTAWAQNPGAGAHLPSQAAADVIRDAAGTDGAFLAAGLVRESYSQDNLASLLQFPTDEIVIVRLKGSEIRQAFERSVSLYPQPNSSFLQISGFTVEFSPAGDPEKRVLNVSAGGGNLDENRSYTVAMPATLGRGGQGYFKIWDKAKIERTLSGVTVESVLKGKRFASTSPRWVSR